MTLYVDINTGEVRRSLTGPVLPSLKFYLNDIIPLTFVLTDTGVAVTSSYFGAGTTMQLAVRGYPLTSTPLVTANNFVLTGQNATGTIDFTPQALSDYFTANVPSGASAWVFIMELQIAANDASSRQTLFVMRTLLARDINTIAGAVIVTLTDDSGNNITDSSGNNVTST